MAIQAAFPNRRMLPDKRAALFLMALIANLVDRIGFQQWRGAGAVRIVAVGAGDFAFGQGHVRAFPELGTLLLMAAVAGLIDAVLAQQSLFRELRHRVMAIATTQVVHLVGRTRPSDTLLASMALKAHGILLTDGRAGLAREYHDFRFIGRVRYMFRARAVAGFAAFYFRIIRRGKMRSARMNRMVPVTGFKFMAAGTDTCSGILGMALRGIEFRFPGQRR